MAKAILVSTLILLILWYTNFSLRKIPNPILASLRAQEAYAVMEVNPGAAFYLLNQAISYNPYSEEYLLKLGELCYRTGNMNLAVSAFSKATELNALRGQSWYNLGVALAKLQNPNAKRAVERAIELEPNNPVFKAAMK